MAKNIMTIEQNGHVYRVVPVEGSDKWYTVTRDGRTTGEPVADCGTGAGGWHHAAAGTR